MPDDELDAKYARSGLAPAPPVPQDRQNIDVALVYSSVAWNASLHDDSLRANPREAETVAELRDLFGLFGEQVRFPGEEMAPDFGAHNHILEGHGDFITDGLLVDVNTTAKPRFTDPN